MRDDARLGLVENALRHGVAEDPAEGFDWEHSLPGQFFVGPRFINGDVLRKVEAVDRMTAHVVCSLDLERQQIYTVLAF